MVRQIIIIALIFLQMAPCKAQYGNIALLPTQEATITNALLHSSEGKRCRIFNIISKPIQIKSAAYAPVLICVKIFYDTSETAAVFESIDKDSLKKSDLTTTQDLVRYYSFRLQSNAGVLISEHTSKQAAAQMNVRSSEKVIFLEDNQYIQAKDAIVYIDAYLLYDFTQTTPLQSSINLINLKAKLVNSVPKEYEHSGKNFLVAIRDCVYRFQTYPFTTDDGHLDANVTEFSYMPGFGIRSFKTQVRPFIKPRRMDDPTLANDRMKKKAQWDRDKLYDFWPVGNVD